MFTVGTLQRHDPLRKERGVKQLLQVEKSSEKGKCNLTPLPEGAISSRKGIKAIPEFKALGDCYALQCSKTERHNTKKDN